MIQQANDTLFQQSLSISGSDAVPGTGLTLPQWQYGISPMPTIPPPSSTLSVGSVGRIMDPTYKNPQTEEFNIGSSYQLSQSSAIELEYVHVLSLHENKTINIDQKVCSDDGAGGVNCVRPLDAAFATAGLPRLNSIRDEASIGRSHYDGVNLTYRQRMSHHFSLNANYTLSWAYSFDGGGGSFRNYPRIATDPFASYEWGPSPNDERHHISLSGIVELGKGFQVAPILQFGTARPYNPTSQTNVLDSGGGTANAVIVPKSDPTNYLAYSSQDAAAEYCFYVTQQCTIAKYDSLRGDAFFQLDTRIAKNFKLGETRNLQLVAQFFNLTNRANYGSNFHNDVQNPSNFGTPAGFINPSSTIIPRSFQSEFGFRFTF
jgi:hypothetical protein